MLPLAQLVVLLPGFAVDLVFSGGLLRVGHGSLAVKLGDRRVIAAKLPNNPRLASGKLAAQYKMGDQVEITCKPIERVWEEETFQFQSIEVEKLRFLREPTAAQLSDLLASMPRREGVNLLPRPPAPPADRTTERKGVTAPNARLEHAREINLERASTLPNFIADETAKRYSSSSKSPKWQAVDKIETKITINGAKAVRQDIQRNGKPWDKQFQALPGFKWGGGFGTELRPMFDLECPTTIDYVGRAEVRGKPALKFRYSSPADGCFNSFYFEYQSYNPARSGHFFVDDPGGNVIQFDEEATGFPSEFEFAERREEVTWDYVKIGDATHLLPVSANFLIRYSSGSQWRIEVEYKNHRHFEASTNITFH